MKPQINTSSGTRKESLKSPERSEVSLSFQDELAATIHGAFEVALEIAVLEVTKLVGQALGDVRDQMHVTLRENKSLKQRLQTAEEQLGAVRNVSSLDDGDESQPLGHLLLVASKTTIRPQSPSPNINSHLLKTPSDNDPKNKSSLIVTVDSPIGNIIVETEHSEAQEYFSEICADGRVCSQDLHPNRESISQNDTIQDAKEEPSGLSIEDETRTGNIDNLGQEAVFADDSDPSALHASVQSPEVQQVQIKEEKKEECNGSGLVSSCSFGPDGEVNFSSDSLSLVQSKMLEEWRPDMLDLVNSNSLVPGTSHALSHPPVPRPDAPELRIPIAGGLPAFSPQFSSLYQPGDPAPAPQAPPQIYGVQVRTDPIPALPPSTHVCKICGQVFQQPSELRRHLNQCLQHWQQQQQRSKPPPGATNASCPRKLQLYPPGSSPFHCTVCRRDFNRMENLKTHLRIHTGERPYTCSVCAMPFRHSGALTRHFRIHTGEKPYVCGQCGKRFRNCGGLKFHQRSHGGNGQSHGGNGQSHGGNGQSHGGNGQ